MKKNYAAYYRPTESEVKDAAKTAVFVFDTNALLDFYRINPEIADKALSVIDRNKDRVYIARHSDEEYHRHLYEVPAQMANTIAAVRQRMNFEKLRAVLNEQFKSDSGCCYPSDLFKGYVEKIEKTYKEIEKAVSELQSRYNTMLDNHELQSRISTVFEDHVLPGLPENEIDKIRSTTGPKRYGAKIPPGYMDAGKASDADDNNTYGDLIIWMEILEYVRNTPKNIFFVGRDNKEDWVSMVGKRKIGPRRELLVEFRSIAPKNIFHICSLTDFIEFFDNDSSLTKDELKALRRKTEESKHNSFIDLLSKYTSIEDDEIEQFVENENNRRYLIDKYLTDITSKSSLKRMRPRGKDRNDEANGTGIGNKDDSDSDSD